MDKRNGGGLSCWRLGASVLLSLACFVACSSHDLLEGAGDGAGASATGTGAAGTGAAAGQAPGSGGSAGSSCCPGTGAAATGGAAGQAAGGGGGGGTPCCTGATVWSRRFGDADIPANGESATAIAVDGQGNLVLGGQFEGKLDFSPAGVLDTKDKAECGFVAKLDSLGSPIWARQITSSSDAHVAGLVVDKSDNITVFGSFIKDIDVGAGPLGTGEYNEWDIYVVSYDSKGTVRYAKVFGGDDWQLAGAIAVAPDGSVALTGWFRGVLSFGGSLLSANVDGGDDVFVARLDPKGNHLWSKRFGDDAFQYGHGIAFDSKGTVVLCGWNSAAIDFGGGELVAAGDMDLFVAKLDGKTGAHVWSKQYGEAQKIIGHGHVLVDPFDHVVLSTETFGSGPLTVDFGNGTRTGHFFVVSLDTAGDALWSAGFMGYYGLHGAASDGAGDLVLVGHVQGSVDMGGGVLTSYDASEDALLAKLSVQGSHLWSRLVGDSNQQWNTQEARAVAVDAQGYAYVTGEFEGTINFGDGELVSGNGYGGLDVFLAKLAP